MNFKLILLVVVGIIQLHSTRGVQKQNTEGKCFWTGCQPKSWADDCPAATYKIGADENCPGENHNINCCRGGGSVWDSSSSITVAPIINPGRGPVAPAPVPISGDDHNCWWTGCQHKALPLYCPASTHVSTTNENCNAGKINVRCCRGKTTINGETRTQISGQEILIPVAPPPISPVLLPTRGDDGTCFWTGCQPKSWADDCPAATYKIGAEESCPAGNHNVNCCRGSGGGGGPILNHPGRGPVAPAPGVGDNNDCWWTGCQQKALPHYCPASTHVSTTNENCNTGKINVRCCRGKTTINEESRTQISGQEILLPVAPPPIVLLPTRGDDGTCFWTGCQPKSWADDCPAATYKVGAEESCPAGNHNVNCCRGSGGGPILNPGRGPTTIITVRPIQNPGRGPVAPAPGVGDNNDCWWTGCQHKALPHYCPASTHVSTTNENCNAGKINVRCCRGRTISQDKGEIRLPGRKEIIPVLPAPAPLPRGDDGKCFWTGCQPNSWADECPAATYKIGSDENCSAGHHNINCCRN